VTSPIEIVQVICRVCGHRFGAPHRASINHLLDPGLQPPNAACPQCGEGVQFETLFIDTDARTGEEVWRYGA
jgi:uncharacterized OB-fold protein